MNPSQANPNDDPRYHTANVAAIKAAMKRYGLTQKELAEYSDISETTVREALHGRRKTLATFQCLANGLNAAKRERVQTDADVTPDNLITRVRDSGGEAGPPIGQSGEDCNSVVASGAEGESEQGPIDSAPGNSQLISVTIKINVLHPKTNADFSLAGIVHDIEQRVKPTHKIIGVSISYGSIVVKLIMEAGDGKRLIQAFESGQCDDINMVEVRIDYESGDYETRTRTNTFGKYTITKSYVHMGLNLMKKLDEMMSDIVNESDHRQS